MRIVTPEQNLTRSLMERKVGVSCAPGILYNETLLVCRCMIVCLSTHPLCDQVSPLDPGVPT